MIPASASVTSPRNAARDQPAWRTRTSASSPNVASGLLARAAPLMSAPVSRTSRAASASNQRADSRSGDRAGSGATAAERGRRDHVGRGRSPHDPLGHVSLAAFLDQLHQTVLFKGLDVVVDLLPSKPKPPREHGRGLRLGQRREHPSPHRIEGDLRSCGVLDHRDILHAVTLSRTTFLVKTMKAVRRPPATVPSRRNSPWPIPGAGATTRSCCTIDRLEAPRLSQHPRWAATKNACHSRCTPMAARTAQCRPDGSPGACAL